MATRQKDGAGDIRLLKASTSLLSTFTQLLQTTLWRSKDGGQVMRRRILTKQADRLAPIIEPFQENPQLLDTVLKQILPSLAHVLASAVELGNYTVPEGYSTPRNVACRVLYTLCKIRGEKVIVNFFSTEPRYLEPLLATFESHDWENLPGSENKRLAWHESYVLMLWFSHLMLAPFDLATISSDDPLIQIRPVSLELPPGLPLIVHRIFPLAFTLLATPAKDRDAAARVLARLCLRLDMRKAGLLSCVMEWIMHFLADPPTDLSGIHKTNSVLLTLKLISSSPSVEELRPFIFPMFERCKTILENTQPGSLGSFAFASRLAAKTVRHLAVHCIQSSQDLDSDLATSLVESAIETLLSTLSSGDSAVRFAASKALSSVTLTLEADMASEVIDVIVDSYNENVFRDDDGAANMAAVDSQKWHGLTLTLAHLLYRRAPPAHKLPAILNALFLALSFEQRSSTGVSLGTNVRDAACFGLWSISRQYRTAELSMLEVDAIQTPTASGDITGLSIIQILARELVAVACLDPVGNIRRGSSAALQELIGRHPKEVLEGIPIVQAVNYSAVGVHERAAVSVSKVAAALGETYWQSLTFGLLGWRGALSNNGKIRSISGVALSGLLEDRSLEEVSFVLDSTAERLRKLKKRQIEERHGLLMAAAAIIADHSPRFVDSRGVVLWLGNYERLLKELDFQPDDFNSLILRPHLTAESVLSILRSLASVLLRIGSTDSANYCSLSSTLLALFNQTLTRPDSSMNFLIQDTCSIVCQCVSTQQLSAQVRTWIDHAAGSDGIKTTPYLLTLGSLFTSTYTAARLNLTEKLQVFDLLLSRCLPPASIEVRVIALQSLELILPHIMLSEEGSESSKQCSVLQERALNVILTCLNDYTITERGDVGSHVRFESLNLLKYLWTADLPILKHLGEVLQPPECGTAASDSIVCRLLAANVRLSLERIDKGRDLASKCLIAAVSEHSRCSIPLARQIGETYKVTADELVSSPIPSTLTPEYFSTALSLISPDMPRLVQLAVVEGICSSTSQGANDLMWASRKGLIKVMNQDIQGVTSLKSLSSSISAGVDEGTCIRVRFMSLLIECIRNQRSKNCGSYKWNDRVAIQLFELLAFVLETGIHPDLLAEPIAKGEQQQETPPHCVAKLRSGNTQYPIPSLTGLTAITHTFHFKSRAVPKLVTAIDVYRSMALCWPLPPHSSTTTTTTTTPAHSRLANFLLHPFPRIRMLASHALWIIDQIRAPGRPRCEDRSFDDTEGNIEDGQSGSLPLVKSILLHTDWMNGLDARAMSAKKAQELAQRPEMTVREAAKIVIDEMSV